MENTTDLIRGLFLGFKAHPKGQKYEDLWFVRIADPILTHNMQNLTCAC